jgi:hypothetical protein
MKYFKEIEILYEKFFIISNYCPVSNDSVSTVVIDVNNIESITDSDSSNEVYNINNKNRNNTVNNSSISDSENNSIVINDIVNSSVGENRVNLNNFLNNEYVHIYETWYQ